MTDKAAGLFDGPAGSEALVVNAVAAAALKIGCPVTLSAAGTGELFPRVTTDTTGTAFIFGVVVGGSDNGIWVDGTTTNDGSAALAAGTTVKVCTKGRCKVRVDGSTGGTNSNIALGDPLSTSGTANIAQRAVASDYIFARALQTSTAFTDAILCEVTLEGVL